MTDSRSSAAIARIESALSRIERIAAAPPQPASNDRPLAELSARHDALRAETQRVLGELDALIGTHG
jgi:hypothetical protein